MLTRSNDTSASLDAIQIARDVRCISDWLFGKFEQWFRQIGAGHHDVARSVRRIQQWSETRALRRNKDIRMLALMSLTQGTFFYADPRFAGTFDRVVRQFELEPDARLDSIYKAFDGWRREVVGLDGWTAIADRTALLLKDDAFLGIASPEDIVACVFPEQSSWVGEVEQKHFISAVIDQGRRMALPTRRHHACHMAISTLLGYRWTIDPKLTCVADHLLSEKDPVKASLGIAQKLTEKLC